LAASVGDPPRVLECVCDDAVARRRLEEDLAGGRHPAANRTFALYQSLKAGAEPLALPRLVLDTGALSVGECVRRSLEYLAADGRPDRHGACR
jgi:hypothetical protein